MIQEDEEFDIDKLLFISSDTGGFDDAGLLNNMLSDDICFMNAIVYNGKMYFAEDEDLEFGENNGEELFDLVNSDMESIDPELYEFR